MPRDDIRVRPATAGDLDTIVRFTLDEAMEAEARALDPSGVERGVRAGLIDGAVIGYWMVEDAANGALLGSASVYAEWSDWLGAPYWWIQSFYIVPGWRGRGLSRRLLQALEDEARRAGAADLRLHVHAGNERAIAAYRRAGFTDRPYLVLGRRPDPTP
jgi:GNAT superfamily N-acetyltransferase